MITFILNNLALTIAIILFAIGIVAFAYKTAQPTNGLELYSERVFAKEKKLRFVRFYRVRKEFRTQDDRFNRSRDWLRMLGDTFPSEEDMMDIKSLSNLPTGFTIQSEIAPETVMALDVGHFKIDKTRKQVDTSERQYLSFGDYDLIAGMSIEDVKKTANERDSLVCQV